MNPNLIHLCRTPEQTKCGRETAGRQTTDTIHMATCGKCIQIETGSAAQHFRKHGITGGNRTKRPQTK